MQRSFYTLLKYTHQPSSAAALRRHQSSSLTAATNGSRLSAMREKVKSDQIKLEEFISGTYSNPVPRRNRNDDGIIIHRKPPWLKAAPAEGEKYESLKKTVRELGLATVCEEAKCPNIGECWGGRDGIATATIMIMGDTCTRGCSFCAVKTSNQPPPLDPEEPQKVATAISKWNLNYVVLTSVDRDDCSDQGASHFAQTVKALKTKCPNILVECLTPDFRGKIDLIDQVAQSGLDVYAHNLETVQRLQSRVRDYRAGYVQSLKVLEFVKNTSSGNLITKTSLMLGCGETPEEVKSTLIDLRSIDCDVVTFGQYLRPSRRHMPMKEYVTPQAFAKWKDIATDMGFKYVASGPMVRSSYRAGEFYMEALLKETKRRGTQN